MSLTLKSLGDIHSIALTRNHSYEITIFNPSGKISYETARGQKQLKQLLDKFEPGSKAYDLTEFTFYEFNIEFNDGTRPQDFSISKRQLENFYSKQIILPCSDFREQVFYMYDSLYCLRLDPSSSYLKTVQIEIPLQIIKDEIDRVNRLPLPEESTKTSIVTEITEEIINFWKPSVSFNWGSGAYELYSQNRNASAQNNKTLTDLIDSLHHMARNYSKNQHNPSFLSIYKDSDNDFVWSIQNAEKRTVFNGGIIFHHDYKDNEFTGTGHYSIHT